MAYIGRQNLGGAYRQLDDISSGFDGSDTTHTMQVNSQNVTVGDVNQIILSLGGVIQKPGTDFTVSGSVLTFTTAPAANTSFFAILLGSDNGGTVTPTDGSVTTTKIVDDAVTSAKLDTNISVAGTLASTGVLTANAGVVVDNITIDGTEIDLSSGDLTIDCASDIILDADGGNIKFRDGGSGVGRLANDSSNLVIQVDNQDNDIKFKGDDGGSAITALSLDMSESGNAAFNATVYIGGSSNTAHSIRERTNVAGTGYAMIGGGLWYVDDRDPKPADFPVGLMANFASYDGNSGGSPYADVIILDLFGHSSAGNANAVFFKKSEVAAQIMQQTTRSTSQFSAGTIRTFDTTSASDENVKEDVVNLTDCLDKVSQLRPVSYKWTDEYINSGLSKNEKENEYEENVLATLYTDDDELPEGKEVGDVKTEGTPLVRKSNAKTTNVGLIAQEVEAVIPTVVHKNRVSLNGEEDYLKNIDYDKLVPHLIGAIKELKAKVEALESA